MPYDPKIQYRGDQFLFEGISDAGDAVAAGVGKYIQHKRERQELGQTAEMLAKMNSDDPVALEKFGEQFQKVPQMSLSQLRGFVGGMTAYSHVKEQKRRDEMDRATIEDMVHRRAIDEDTLGLSRSQLDRQNKEDSSAAGFSKALGDYLSAPDVNGADRKVTPETIAKFAGQTGYDPLKASAAAENYLRLQRTPGLSLADLQPMLGAGQTATGGGQASGAGPGDPGFMLSTFSVNPNGTVTPNFGRRAWTEAQPVMVGGVKSDSAVTPDGKLVNIPGMNASEGSQLANYGTLSLSLDALEKAINEYGSWEVASAEGKSKLRTMQASAARAYLKATDPNSQTTIPELNLMQEMRLRMGPLVRPSESLQDIASMRDEMLQSLKTLYARHGQLPSGLAPKYVDIITGKSKGADSNKAANDMPSGQNLKTDLKQDSGSTNNTGIGSIFLDKKTGLRYQLIGADKNDPRSYRPIY